MEAFIEMMDRVRVSFESKQIILLGDFNMDLKKNKQTNKQIPDGKIALTHIMYTNWVNHQLR